MTNQKTVRAFFDLVIRDYNCGDIEALLALDLDKAGPLLACVVNGIDTIGGMMNGFNTGSRARSVEFLKQHLALPPHQAELLYVVIRCGFVHEGVTKLGITFFVHVESLDPGVFLYRSSDGAIWLNVSELARQYLDAIARINENVHQYLHHVPSARTNDESVYAAAYGSIKKDIQDFCREAHAAQEAAEDAQLAPGEARGSSSPFLTSFLSSFEAPRIE